MGLLPLLVTSLLLPQGGGQAAEASARRDQESERAVPLDEARHRLLEEAAERGLQWLAGEQLETGAWTGIVGHKRMNDYVVLERGLPVSRQRATGRGHMGVTSLCGMAFLAGGHLPDRGPYGRVVQRAVDYVLSHVQENGLIEDSGTRMYSHAFATLFLAEVYGMAGGDEVKKALERAVHIIVDCQNTHGAWRYNPFSREADLSVTVCQLQALRAARNIGIKVPYETIERAVRYVKDSRTPYGPYAGLYYYKIHGAGAYEKNREYAINAAALTALYSAGIYEAELTDPALEFLTRQYGTVADYFRHHYFFWYGNYYACQAFFQSGGPRFASYFRRISDDLLAMQRRDGRWENDVGPGDEFSTAIACIVLQIPKQYLPIFQR